MNITLNQNKSRNTKNDDGIKDIWDQVSIKKKIELDDKKKSFGYFKYIQYIKILKTNIYFTYKFFLLVYLK